MLVILDGWGLRDAVADNAVHQARTPIFDGLMRERPRARLRTFGADVGLPEGQMGNSEVGHLNIGAGRVVMQDLPRIDAAVADGSLATNPALVRFIDALRATGGTCHLVGLLSPGGVHAHQDHAVALARVLVAAGLPVRLHAFTDGRDMPPRSATPCIEAVEAALPEGARIATVCGRYYAMDRDRRWERVQIAYEAMAIARGAHFETALQAITAAYAEDLSDEFMRPAIIGDYAGMRDGDGVLSFNFRADRTRQILEALFDPAFAGFPRARTIRFAAALGIVQYSVEIDAFAGTLFAPLDLPNGLGETVARAGRTQLRMAETEKYPHVTYFMNGGREAPFEGQDAILVPSPRVATYDLQPEMSAPELTDRAVAAIGSGRYDLIILNFANPDMVGHTGSLAAAVTAVETVDACLGRVVDAITGCRGALLVTADHGNCEMMRDPRSGEPHTAHTLNPVPVMLVGVDGVSLADGRLADVAPTLLDLMGLAQPAEMTGVSLIRRAPGP
ncbi:2,3-bisphosphoglycerate-independent phosphoglycerate mutase [Methylobacterium sp. NEAU K]|uniref:2,3-bisphosphoglycerate-independent phosphoglycerate mutase n=1 Tax=Methylobacterium sp. NEAU K TaxID=3064946 RepID=UPI0027336DC5|nr:2,3-bisphosphoglycerate-independent phosphoglycerate mutase [Methylobacterium sp. NEAU K]MDP4005845.1 2,3-bisphosphoglycerate-independent phosphoglycerate mutase [Methylobacterium sp. NEAU K]